MQMLKLHNMRFFFSKNNLLSWIFKRIAITLLKFWNGNQYKIEMYHVNMYNEKYHFDFFNSLYFLFIKDKRQNFISERYGLWVNPSKINFSLSNPLQPWIQDLKKKYYSFAIITLFYLKCYVPLNFFLRNITNIMMLWQ